MIIYRPLSLCVQHFFGGGVASAPTLLRGKNEHENVFFENVLPYNLCIKIWVYHRLKTIGICLSTMSTIKSLHKVSSICFKNYPALEQDHSVPIDIRVIRIRVQDFHISWSVYITSLAYSVKNKWLPQNVDSMYDP